MQGSHLRQGNITCAMTINTKAFTVENKQWKIILSFEETIEVFEFFSIHMLPFEESWAMIVE